MLGPGGIAAVILIKRYGRLPVLFWSQLIGLGFLIGCAVAPDLKTFAAMRILNAFFSTAPQCVGLWTGTPLSALNTREFALIRTAHNSLRSLPLPPSSTQAHSLDIWWVFSVAQAPVRFANFVQLYRFHRISFRLAFPPRLPRG